MALTPGWPDDPDTVAEAKEHPEVFANKSIGQIADHFDEVIAGPRQEAGDHRPFLRRPADPDPRRPRPLRRLGRLRLGAVPRRPAAADLVAEIGQTGAREPGQPRPRRAAHLRPVPLLLRQHLQRGRGQAALQRILGAGLRRAAVPGRERQLQPLDRGEGRPQKPRPRADADRLRRARTTSSPKAINKAIFKKQEKNKGVTEFVEIEGRGPRHGLTIGSALARQRSATPRARVRAKRFV